MKEVQNKIHTDEAKRLNEELDQNLKDLQPESKEAFQGFEVKEEKNEKKKKVKKKKTPKQIIKRVIIVLAVIILLPCAAIVGMWALGKGSLFGGKMKMSKNVDGVKVQNQGDLVIYNGHKYQYNKDIEQLNKERLRKQLHLRWDAEVAAFSTIKLSGNSFQPELYEIFNNSKNLIDKLHILYIMKYIQYMQCID